MIAHILKDKYVIGDISIGYTSSYITIIKELKWEGAQRVNHFNSL